MNALYFILLPFFDLSLLSADEQMVTAESWP
jgi:hypothetical protein